MLQNDLTIIPEKIVIMAQKLGAEHSEVCLIDGKQLSINIEESNIVKTESKSFTGVGLRVLH